MYYIGYSAQLYCLWEYESVHVCGKVLGEELAIPTSEPELEWFMDGGCMAALLSLRVSKVFACFSCAALTLKTSLMVFILQSGSFWQPS